MRLLMTGAFSSAAIVLLSAVASPQSPPQVPPPSQIQRPGSPVGRDGAARDQVVAVTGCVQRESDYRRLHQVNTAVTVVGAGNDLVLINAEASVIGSPIAGTRSETPRQTPSGGGAGSAGQIIGGSAGAPAITTGSAYQLTGSRENDAAVYVGRWVEITGTLRDPEVVRPAITPTSGEGPVADVTNRELNLRQLEIDSVRTLSGACAAQ